MSSARVSIRECNQKHSWLHGFHISKSSSEPHSAVRICRASFWLHEFINDVKSGTLKLESSKYADMKVQAADAEMTVVTYRSTDKRNYKGKDISGDYRSIDVFAKRGGRWQVIVSQGTKIATQ